MLPNPITRLLPFIKTGGHRVSVPRDLNTITTIHRDRECSPQSLGINPANIERIWQSVQSYYKTGLHPAITLVIRHKGQIVMSRLGSQPCGCGR
ncbi:MAG: hypothetical protein IPI79_14875 [Moraxellaceae bacterium]|nr:hypothetical protein [Moraxellaceae bacterium]